MPFEDENPPSEGTGNQNPNERGPTTGNPNPNPNPSKPQRRPYHGYTKLARNDPNRENRSEGKEGLKIRVNADLALDLDIQLKGELYGDLVIGLITSDQ